MKKVFNAIFGTIKSVIKQYSERSVGAYSAQAAFFIFVSFFPFAIIVFYALNCIPGFVDAIPTETPGFIPKILMVIISEAREQAHINNTQTLILVISVATALWSASKGIYAISLGLDNVKKPQKRRNAIISRFLATVYTVVFVVMIIVVLALLVFGNSIHDQMLDAFPNIAVALFVIRSFRFVLLLLILILFFAITYKFLPTAKMMFSEVIPGAVITSFGWLGFSYLYSLYIDNYNVSASVYGSLATIVLLMLWLYFCMNIILFGALVNSWLSNGRIDLG